MKKQHFYVAFIRGSPVSVHHTWADCYSVIGGVSHSSSKKFRSLVEAEEVLERGTTSVAEETHSPPKIDRSGPEEEDSLERGASSAGEEVQQYVKIIAFRDVQGRKLREEEVQEIFLGKRKRESEEDDKQRSGEMGR